MTAEITGLGESYDNVKPVGASATPAPPAQLGVHNTLYPSQMRVERLPFATTPVNAPRTTSDKQSLWQSAYKENKDYSKYMLPQGSTRKKTNEDCKTQ
ncbi:hypothetical protein SK128_019159 [Halocaridina rubra]|uniref:Uncharacterized protein n=1 Tax=Halocaridina rubra TaxID=373956 RepID=A0AAN9A6V6_HALRR